MEPPTAHHAGHPPSSLSLTQQAVNAVRGAPPMSPPQHVVPSGPPPLIRSVSPPMTHSASPKPDPGRIIESSPGRNGDIGPDEELLLKWDDHHKSFFELAEDLCHQELFIDVTLSCGEHNFPAHKLVLSVCSPYFRHLFLRNPCKHPIVVLKDVHFKYMKLLLMYMYRGEVSCPQEDLHGLLKTARSLQIRGLVELERKREAEGFLQNSITGSPIKRIHGERMDTNATQGDGASTTSCDIGPHSGDEFSLDEVRHRLHGQLDIQPISQVPQSSTHGIHPNTTWFNRDGEGQSTPPPQAHTTTGGGKGSSTGSDGGGVHSEEDAGRHQIVRHPHHRLKNEPPSNGQRSPHHWADNNGGVNHHNRASPLSNNIPHEKFENYRGTQDTRGRSPRAGRPPQPNSANNAAILAAAQAAGMPMSALDPADPMSSMNALLAAAQAHGKKSPLPIPSTLASLLPPNLTAPSSTSTSGSRTNTSGSMPPGSRPPPGGPPGNGTASGNGDLSQAATMANLQLYYYMQKVASAGMGNPKERKECPICGKTLYDRSTWNRHMRIHTGEKPYPCQFCGRRFRTNYNKLGHEKKCPDRHAQDLANTQTNVNNSNKTNEHNSNEPPQKIMLNLNNQAVPVTPSAGGGRASSIPGSQTTAPPPPTAQTAEYR